MSRDRHTLMREAAGGVPEVIVEICRNCYDLNAPGLELLARRLESGHHLIDIELVRERFCEKCANATMEQKPLSEAFVQALARGDPEVWNR